MMLRVAEITDGVRIAASRFVPERGGRGEIHAVLEPVDVSGGIAGQAHRVRSALRGFLESGTAKNYVPVMARAFLSDVTNQADELAHVFKDFQGAFSMIGQPPLCRGVKIVLLVIMVEDVTLRRTGGHSVRVGRGAYSDIWSVLPAYPGVDSKVAAAMMLRELASQLGGEGMDIPRNCLRTWFYVRDIDNRYKGMVEARNEFFAGCGLTAGTHFIASTGIEGANRIPDAMVSLDAFATGGLKPAQVKYISAPAHLNPTAQYGVAFERATAVDYGDRRNVIVSGTASINNKGEIVAPGDVSVQCARMADNVEALLQSADVCASDLCHIVLYLRDSTDGEEALRLVAERFPDVPCVAVHAAVCRPGWLVEMECMAVADANNPGYAPY